MKLSRGERVCAFIEKYCRVPSGDSPGAPMQLEPFQRRFIIDVYDNPYSTRRAYLSIARKNGKTALIAAIVLAHLVGPEAKLNTQIVSGAQSREQAGIVFDLAYKMIQLNEDLAPLVRVVPSSKRLIGVSKNVEYRALSAEGKTAYGLSPILAILDEVGQVEGPRDKFITAITTSQGAYANPLLLAISTQSPSDQDLFSIWLDAPSDPRVIKHVYSAPEDCSILDRSAWYAANPALGKFKSLETFEQDAKQADSIKTAEPEFRNLDLNQRVDYATPFVSKSTWLANGAKPEPLDGKKVWAGLDLSSVSDLTAFVMVGEDGSVEPTFWLPKPGLCEKSQKDLVPWDLYEKEGYLQTTPGPAIEYEYVAKYLRVVFDRCNVQAVGFDRYNMKHLKPWLEKADFSAAEMDRFIEFGQGTASMTPALRELEVKLVNRQLKHGANPILNLCSNNAVIEGHAGARKFSKERARGRIDGMVALAMAIGVMPIAEEARDYGVVII